MMAMMTVMMVIVMFFKYTAAKECPQHVMFSFRAAYQNATYAAAALACTGPNGPPANVFYQLFAL